MSAAEFDDDLFDRVSDVVGPGTAILTLSTKNLNRVTTVERKGVWVETERSMSLGSGPQLVPAWMIAAAWDRLCDKGELSQQELLNELNVKRSAFVCALIAKFPEVHIRSTRPTVLEMGKIDAYRVNIPSGAASAATGATKMLWRPMITADGRTTRDARMSVDQRQSRVQEFRIDEWKPASTNVTSNQVEGTHVVDSF